MSPFISVALCTYNGEKFLEQQLTSILNQTMMVSEVVVFDDGSKDASLEILQNFKASAPFPVLIHQNSENLGSSKNFENCISTCQGEFIFLCDQDDIWDRHKVEKQIAYLNEHPDQDAVFSNAIMINQLGVPTGKTSFEQIEFTHEAQQHWVSGNSFDILLRGYVVTGATLAIRSKIIPEVFPIPAIINELIHDGWMALWLAINNRIGFLKDALVFYREHEQQQVGLKSNGKVVTIWDRLTRNRASKLEKITKKYADSEALLNYLSQKENIPSEIIRKLSLRVEHYGMRSTLPKNRLKRFLPVLMAGVKGNYKLQDGGKWWHPILGDLLE
ncbi:glycosyltransferase family 2 protein [Aquirufa sp. ROCK-SH2]